MITAFSYVLGEAELANCIDLEHDDRSTPEQRIEAWKHLCKYIEELTRQECKEAEDAN